VIKEVIGRLVAGENLTEAESEAAMNEIMSGEATAAQIAAFMTALRVKGETAAELTGCARAMRRHATAVNTVHQEVLDTCGTGGDRSGTFNISTAAAFVVAGAGVPVAKHGNRSVTSQSGSADVLEELGVNIDLDAPQVSHCLDAIGIGFLFAPKLHPAMRHAVGPRRELGIRSIFNLLGPLTNPAGARYQLLGVYAPELTELVAETLLRLGTRRALVVHGAGMDEITLAGPTKVTEVQEGGIRTYTVNPEEFGLALCPPEALRGGTPAENAALIAAVLRGEASPRRNVVLLNAAGALVAAGAADDLQEGFCQAAWSIDSGAAQAKLEALRTLTQEMKACS